MRRVKRGCSPGMQPHSQTAPTSADVPAVHSPNLAAARDAWFRGDFLTCLELLDAAGVPPAGSAQRSEAVLLRARALYRLRRYVDVIAVLEPELPGFEYKNEVCTARMLYGAATARSGAGEQLDRGLAMLADVAAAARTLNAHGAIQAEIAHAQALAYWTKRDFDQTLHFAGEAERARADVISVRATQLRGFVALTRHRYNDKRAYEAALAIFRGALRDYHVSRERDADLAEMTVLQIAALELALRCATVAGTHATPDGRQTRELGEPEPAIGSVVRMQTLAVDAWLYAHDGDVANAFRKVREAESIAAARGAAWHAWALANRAGIADAFGELASAREHAAHAVELADSVAWDATAGEERVGLLLLAEVLASTDPLAAVSVLRRYDALTSSMRSDEVFSDDPRLSVLEYFVRGLVARIRGDRARARTLLTQAYRLAVQYGVSWRAALSLIELDATATGVTPRGDFYLEAAAIIIRENFPRSYLERRLGRWRKLYEDPVTTALTRSQRDVLRRLVEGRSLEEIAAVTNRSVNTVRNHASRLRDAFGVHSNEQVIIACLRRGIGVEAPPAA